LEPHKRIAGTGGVLVLSQRHSDRAMNSNELDNLGDLLSPRPILRRRDSNLDECRRDPVVLRLGPDQRTKVSDQDLAEVGAGVSRLIVPEDAHDRRGDAFRALPRRQPGCQAKSVCAERWSVDPRRG
jgi:hypothetical protein